MSPPPAAATSTALSPSDLEVGDGEDLPEDYGERFPEKEPGERRRVGVLLHPTSLRGPYGIGDLGDEAIRFLDWLQAAGCSVWQVSNRCVHMFPSNTFLAFVLPRCASFHSPTLYDNAVLLWFLLFCWWIDLMNGHVMLAGSSTCSAGEEVEGGWIAVRRTGNWGVSKFYIYDNILLWWLLAFHVGELRTLEVAALPCYI